VNIHSAKIGYYQTLKPKDDEDHLFDPIKFEKFGFNKI
jgi:hypothetical protein